MTVQPFKKSVQLIHRIKQRKLKMLSKFILNSMKEFDGYDEERILFDEIRVIDFPVKRIKVNSVLVKSMIDSILEKVEVK
jgi:hypothetical protein